METAEVVAEPEKRRQYWGTVVRCVEELCRVGWEEVSLNLGDDRRVGIGGCVRDRCVAYHFEGCTRALGTPRTIVSESETEARLPERRCYVGDTRCGRAIDRA